MDESEWYVHVHIWTILLTIDTLSADLSGTCVKSQLYWGIDFQGSSIPIQSLQNVSPSQQKKFQNTKLQQKGFIPKLFDPFLPESDFTLSNARHYFTCQRFKKF